MRVAELMIRGFQSIDAHATVRHAALLMGKLGTAILPVHDAGKLVGEISASHIALAVAREPRPELALVASVMNRAPRYCHEDQDASDVLREMATASAGLRVVLSRSGRPIGVLPAGAGGLHGVRAPAYL